MCTDTRFIFSGFVGCSIRDEHVRELLSCLIADHVRERAAVSLGQLGLAWLEQVVGRGLRHCTRGNDPLQRRVILLEPSIILTICTKNYMEPNLYHEFLHFFCRAEFIFPPPHPV
jgi:hypothetical protein